MEEAVITGVYMAKEGMDSFLLDCHTNDNISEIESSFGVKGFAVIVRLWQKIYSEKGYYCEWSDRSPVLFLATWFGGNSGVDVNFISEVVRMALKNGIFSEDVYSTYKVLTSAGIQRRYFEVAKRRTASTVIEEYLLVDVSILGKNVNIISISANRNQKNVSRNQKNVNTPSSACENPVSVDRNQENVDRKSDVDRNPKNVDRNQENVDRNAVSAALIKENRRKVNGIEGNVRENCAREREDTQTMPLGDSFETVTIRENERRDIAKLIEARNFPPRLEFALKDWMQYKEQLGHPYYSSGANALIVQVGLKADEIGADAVCEAITESMANNWGSIVFDRVEARMKRKSQKKKSTGGYDWDAVRRALEEDDN